MARRRGRRGLGGTSGGGGGGEGRTAGARGGVLGEVGAAPPAELDDRPAVRFGTILGCILLAVGLLLLVLSAVGRGWPYLLGAIDFLAVGAVIVWAARHRRHRGP